MLPPIDVLVALGAKDTSLIAQGEYWRIVTPMFMHIGIVHFLFNNFGIYIIAPYVEMVFGKWLFLIIYIGSGILGNLFSSVFSLNVSAGASGALFGLMGVGFALEYLANKRLKAFAIGARSRAFAFLLLLNLTIGLVLPSIDLAAHLGGLLFGLLASLAILSLRANNLIHYSRRRGQALIAGLAVLLFVSTYLAVSRDYVYQRFVHAGDDIVARYVHQTQHCREPLVVQCQHAYHYYSDAIALHPTPMLYFKRGRLLVWAEQLTEALDDLRLAATDREARRHLRDFLYTHRRAGHEEQADFLEKKLYDIAI